MAKELKIAEERLGEKEILGVVATGKVAIRVNKVAGKEKQQLLQGEICEGEEENRMGKNGRVETSRCLDKMGVYG